MTAIIFLGHNHGRLALPNNSGSDPPYQRIIAKIDGLDSSANDSPMKPQRSSSKSFISHWWPVCSKSRWDDSGGLYILCLFVASSTEHHKPRNWKTVQKNLEQNYERARSFPPRLENRHHMLAASPSTGCAWFSSFGRVDRALSFLSRFL